MPSSTTRAVQVMPRAPSSATYHVILFISTCSLLLYEGNSLLQMPYPSVRWKTSPMRRDLQCPSLKAGSTASLACAVLLSSCFALPTCPAITISKRLLYPCFLMLYTIVCITYMIMSFSISLHTHHVSFHSLFHVLLPSCLVVAPCLAPRFPCVFNGAASS